MSEKKRAKSVPEAFLCKAGHKHTIGPDSQFGSDGSFAYHKVVCKSADLYVELHFAVDGTKGAKDNGWLEAKDVQ